ncbi:exodeoxyribonuclease III [Blattabacterium cuenoti]|uniref:exodeoxyribonuclease III n=1 Tax=Blattabacterium cuenoti TaxID=1653831 RepID=UPI00163D1918|nr:exodeoxyribonuclease III [Blattabacterium cuenoti]
MKIVSYNINGIRSVIRKGFVNWINMYHPDIICLQEIKAFPEQINTSLFEHLKYYCYWFPSQRKGYSGVAILSKKKPLYIKYGIGLESIDKEGRVLRIDINFDKKRISIINIYLPSGSNMEKRLSFKFFFMKKFFSYIKKLKKNMKNILICGDFNICYSDIDIHDPENNQNISGFLPQERKWIENLVRLGFIDSFRFYVKTRNHYSWWNYRFNARKKNKGWRIDYIMVSHILEKYMKNAYLLPEIYYSDHCPMVLELSSSFDFDGKMT